MYIPEQVLTSDWNRACYRIGEKTTQSKIQALIWANDNPDNIVFDFNDSFWSKQDWTVEPTETWQELCQRRAVQIRSNFNKVILWFSGGYDSLTIAWSFIWAGIPIDEIIIFDKVWYDENVCKYAYELAKWLKNNHWPQLKIRFLVLDHNLVEGFYNELQEDWIYSPHFRTDMTKNSRLAAINTNVELMRELEDPGTTMIDGWDKPRLDIFNDTWYARITDAGYNWYFNTPVNNFYINSAMPELQIKQTWLTLKFMEEHGICTNAQVHDVQKIDRWNETEKPFTYQQYASAPGRVTPEFWFAREYVNKILYVGGIKNAEARSLFNHYQSTGSKIFDIYWNGLKQIKQMLPNSVSQSLNLKPIMGTPHFLKPVSKPQLVQ